MKKYTKMIKKTEFLKLCRPAMIVLLMLFGFMQNQTVMSQVIFSSSMSDASRCQLIVNGGSGTQPTFVDAGWISYQGYHITSNSNYYTGLYGSGALRSWFAFNYSGGTITSATLRVYTWDITGGTPTYIIYPINNSYTYADLDFNRSAGDVTGTAIFNSIPGSASIGSITTTASQSYIDIAITDVSTLNGMGSSIRIGGKADSYSGGYTAPTLTTNAATSVISTSATLNASLTANSNSGNVRFEYGTSSGAYSTFTSYQSYSSNATPSVSVSLSPGTTYYYRAHATVSGHSDVYGSEVSFSTPPTDITSVTPSVSTICNGQNTQLTAAGVDGTVYWYTASCGGTFVTTGNPITVYPTTTTTYYARNYKNSLFSAACATTTITVNNPATVPTAASCLGTTSNTASLSWSASSGTGTITYYWVVGTSASVTYGSGVAQGTTTATTTTATGLSPSTQYYMRVYATTASPCGDSYYQTSSQFTTVPDAPVATAATVVRANSFTANWNVSTGATKYYLDLSTSPSFASFVPGYNNKDVGNVLLYSITGLSNNTPYYYRVRAYNAGGNSVNSNQITLNTLPLNNFLIETAGGGNIPDQTAGQNFYIKITARDAFNTTVNDYTGIASITTNSVLTLGGSTVSFTAGVLTSHSVILTQAGLNKTLTATDGSVNSTSNPFEVIPGAINHWTLVANGPVYAGTPFTVTTTVYDLYNNIKTNYNGSNNVSWTTTAWTSNSGIARIIPADGPQTFTAGVATVGGFTFFNSDQSQVTTITYPTIINPTITVTDVASAIPGTTSVTVLNAPLDNFKVIAATPYILNPLAVHAIAGTPFSTTVTARDIYWNTCVDYVGNIRFKSSNDALVTFPAGLQPYISSDKGVRTFSNQIQINTVGSYWLRAADAIFAYKSGQQENIIIEPGAFSNLVTKSDLYISDPTTPTNFVDPLARVAGQNVLVTLTPRDANGNLLYDCRNISILLDGNVYSSTFTTGHNGTYTATITVTQAGTHIVGAQYNYPLATWAQTRTVTVSPAPANHFAVTGSSSQQAGTSQTITLTALDPYNNIATGHIGAHSVIFSGANPSPSPSANPKVNGTDFGSATSLNFSGGVVTATMSLYKVEVANINATEGVINASGNTLTVTVTEASPAYLAITGSSPQTAGTSQVITIRAYDAFNNFATAYTGAKPLTFSGASVSLPTPTSNPTIGATAFGSTQTITFTAGTATATMTLFKVETATVTTTDGLINADAHRLNVVVNAAAANYFAITGAGTQVAGTTQTITVTAYDQYNNVASGYTGAHSLTFSGANPSPTPVNNPTIGVTNFGVSMPLTFASGVATATMTLFKVETATITTADGPINANTHRLTVVVSHATPNYFTVTGAGTQTAGTSQTITVSAFDAYNNPVTTYSGPHSLTFTGANPSPAPPFNPTIDGIGFTATTTVSFNLGVATATMTLFKVETASITTTDGTINANAHKLSVIVSHAPANYFAVTGSPTMIAGNSQLITVTTYDAYNNVATGYIGTHTLTFSGASPSPSPVNNPTIGGINFGVSTPLVFTSGVTSATMTLFKVETASITTTDGGLINANTHRLSVVVTPAILKDFLVYGVQSPHDLCTRQSVTVEALDLYNNRKIDYVGKVTFSNTDFNAINPNDYIYTTGLGADNGIHTFINEVQFSQNGSWWLTALDWNEPTKYGAQANILVQRAITITANNQSKTYGDIANLGTTSFTITDIGTCTATYNGTITNVTLTSTGSTATATVFGSPYDIVPSQATGTFNPNFYRIVYSTAGKLTVNRRTLLLSNFLADNKIYDGTTNVYGPSVPFSDNRVNSDILSFTYTRAFSDKNAANGKAVNYTAISIPSTGDNNNYTLGTITGTATADIIPATLTVTASDQTKCAYEILVSPSTQFITSGLITGETVTSVILTSTGGSATSTAGTYPIIPSGAIGGGGFLYSNYTINYVNGSLLVNPAPTPTISGLQTLCSDGSTITYSTPNVSGHTYQWTISGGVITSGGNTNQITVVWNPNCINGWLQVKEIITSTGCFVLTTQYPVTVNPLPAIPVITGSTTVNSGSPYYTYSITNPVSGNLYSWNVIGGAVVSGQGTASVVINWGTANCANCINGSVSVIESTPLGCSATSATLSVTINISTGTYTLSGHLTYDNTSNTPLNGVTLQLLNNSGIVVGTTTTSATNSSGLNVPAGYYEFTNMASGNYTLNVSSTKPWGGVTATDALLIQLHSIGTVTLTASTLPYVAADVNAANGINSTDALITQLRIVGLMNQFAAGDWKFNNAPISISGANLVYNFKGICVADVNKSYNTSFLKQLTANTDGVQDIQPKESFTYNLKAISRADLGAMTLFMNYDPNLFEIEKVNSSLSGLKYKVENGEIALAWFDSKSVTLNADETVISLQIKAKTTIENPTQIFSYNNRSEFADPNASILDNFGLKMADVQTVNNEKSFSITNYPNPAKDVTYLVYNLPEQAKVKITISNMFGQTIGSIVDEVQTGGTYKIAVNASDLNLLSGIYMYQIEVKCVKNNYSKLGKIVFER